MSAIDLDAAVATYWSGMRVGVTDADVVAAPLQVLGEVEVSRSADAEA